MQPVRPTPLPQKITLILEYDGRAYSGFQRQTNAPSVQQTVETAWLLLTGIPARLKAAGRTDSGVHATGQVITFESTTQLTMAELQKGLNHYLPDDIAIKASYVVSPDFDPRRSALRRVYRYTLLCAKDRSPLRRQSAYFIGRSVDTATMQECLTYLEGTRDFAVYSGAVKPGASTIRRLYRAQVWREQDEVYIELEGNAFLPQQVRRIVGSILQVGLGRMTIQEFKIQAESGHSGAAQWVVPPWGLCLRQVYYREVSVRSHERQQDNHPYTVSAIGPPLAGS